MNDAERVYRLCVQTKRLVQRLQPMKLISPPRHPDERGSSNRPGARGPAPGQAAVDLELDLCRFLRNSLLSFDVLDVPPVPRDLAAQLVWVYNNLESFPAGDSAELATVIEHVRDSLAVFVDKGDFAGWETGPQVVARFRRMGIVVTPAQLRTWVSRGHIQAQEVAGRRVFDFAQVVEYLANRG